MPDFVLCLGDDHTDEGEWTLAALQRNLIEANLCADMFRSLRASNLKEDHVFAVTIGAGAKQTLAKWHLVEPPDVIAAIALLNSSGDSSRVEAQL
jgi:trehalose 6-phosphate synthase/phosphatase